MKNFLLALIALPLTAAATAGATVIALKYSGAWPLDPAAHATSEPITAPREPVPPVAPPATPVRSAPDGPSDMMPSSAPLVLPEAAPIAADTDFMTGALRVVHHLRPEPASVAPAPELETRRAPDAPASPQVATIDFLKLSEEIDRISVRLDRFNRKLMAAIGQDDQQRRSGGTQLAPSPSNEEAAP